MEIIKLIAYILCSLYFVYKLVASIYVYFKYSLEEIKALFPTVKNKEIYLLGTTEHLFFLILINLIYFI